MHGNVLGLPGIATSDGWGGAYWKQEGGMSNVAEMCLYHCPM